MPPHTHSHTQAPAAPAALAAKGKSRGKSSSMNRFLRKNANIIDAKRQALKEKLARDEQRDKKQKEGRLKRV